MVANAQEYSQLWGKNGENWTPTSRLPDFSFAGYHFGEDPLPVVDVVASVKDFGAIGDGKHDDTDAFKRAIAETDAGAIHIPAGRYILSDIIWINKPNIVLRGDGTDKTILFFPKGLEEVKPDMAATTGGRPTSNYSWSGGFLWAKGKIQGKTIGTVTAPAKRGDTRLSLTSTAGLKPCQRVILYLEDDDSRSLLSHVYSGDPGDTSKITKPIKTNMVSRVTAIDGNTITLERPLRIDIQPSWSPTIKHFKPTVSEVGIEHLTCEFPVTPYAGHFTEIGRNAIAINQASDCWVKNVRISHSDSGIFVGGHHCTVDGVVLDSDRKPFKGDSGHHGIDLGKDCLVTNVDFQTHFIHDVTVDSDRVGNVFKNSRGVNLSLDHHKRATYENLFTNLDVGKGTEIWRCGGGHALGRHCAARGTFWCIRSKTPITWPFRDFGPDSMNLVGLQTNKPSILDPDGKWFEAIPPAQLLPADLHAAQLARRLATRPKE